MWAPSFVAALAVAGFMLTVRVFYPGVMTYDSYYIYQYIAEGRAGDWQSPVMTALWALIDPIAPGAGSMFLLIAATYWLGFLLLGLAVARTSLWLGGVAILLALAPPAFALVGVIWRDILLGSAWLLAATLAFATAGWRGAPKLMVQAIAIGLLALGVLLRPNALLAAPVLAAYLIWPRHFELKRAAMVYLPALVILALLIPLVYYGMLDAKRQNPVHQIFVFDLGGIAHFAKANHFPVAFTPSEITMLLHDCYRPIYWDIYWKTTEPCSFVMKNLENEGIFGSRLLIEAWLRAIVAHPLAYLQHRMTIMASFLGNQNLTMWTADIGNIDRVLFGDNPWFVALTKIHAWLAPTILFRAGAWSAICVAWCAVMWRHRKTPEGAFVIGATGSATIYVLTFFVAAVAIDFRYVYWPVLAALAATVVVAKQYLVPLTRRAAATSHPDPATR